MANPTLTKGSGTFASSGTAVLTLYNAQRENPRKSSNLLPLPMPSSDSDDALAFDFLGVTRDIAIEGVFTVSDGTIHNFTADLDSLQDGNQGDTGGGQVGYTLQLNSYSSTIRVYVNECSWEEVAGEPNKISYSLTLIQVSPSSA